MIEGRQVSRLSPSVAFGVHVTRLLSNIGACNTATSPPSINPTDEANAPLIYAAISAKCSKDGYLGYLSYCR